MINSLLQNISQIYIAYGATDFRKQIDSLCNLVQEKYKLDPYKKVGFIFCNRKRTSIKVLVYDKNGFILAQKKLLENANCRFKWPRNSEEMKEITKQQLAWLLSGLTIEPKGYFKDVNIVEEKLAV